MTNPVACLFFWVALVIVRGSPNWMPVRCLLNSLRKQPHVNTFFVRSTEVPVRVWDLLILKGMLTSLNDPEVTIE